MRLRDPDPGNSWSRGHSGRKPFRWSAVRASGMMNSGALSGRWAP